MSDIVERLRREEARGVALGKLSLGVSDLCKDARVEIERLRAIIEAPLPCEVKLPPATIFGKGVPMSTLLVGLDQRRKPQYAEHLKFTRATLSPEPHQ